MKEAVKVKGNLTKVKSQATNCVDKISSGDLAYKWADNAQNKGELVAAIADLDRAEASNGNIKDFLLSENTKSFRSKFKHDDAYLQALTMVIGLQGKVNEVNKHTKRILIRSNIAG